MRACHPASACAVTELLRERFLRPAPRLSRRAGQSWKADGRIAIAVCTRLSGALQPSIISWLDLRVGGGNQPAYRFVGRCFDAGF